MEAAVAAAAVAVRTHTCWTFSVVVTFAADSMGAVCDGFEFAGDLEEAIVAKLWFDVPNAEFDGYVVHAVESHSVRRIGTERKKEIMEHWELHSK